MKFINKKIATSLSKKSQYDTKNVYGVEVELENYNGLLSMDITKINKYWHIDNDDSLRAGVEFVSKPLTQIELKAAIAILQDIVLKAKLKTSKRCSIHVHVNMLNLTWGQFLSFIGLNTLLEPDLFTKFAPERAENHFCVPTYWNTKFIETLANDGNFLRSMDTSIIDQIPKLKPSKKSTKSKGILEPYTYTVAADLVPPKSTNAKKGVMRYLHSFGISSLKYSAVSLFRFPDLGTAEFRILPGTTDLSLVLEWVQFLGRLKQFAVKYPEPLEVQRFYEKMGRYSLWKTLQLGPFPLHTPRQERNAAEEAAFKIIGAEPIAIDDLNWKFS